MHLLPYCVYVLYSFKDHQFYTGFTRNLPRRIAHHNQGHTISTRNRRPLKIIFCEYYLSHKDALRREKYFKTTTGKKVLKLMIRDSLKIVTNK